MLTYFCKSVVYWLAYIVPALSRLLAHYKSLSINMKKDWFINIIQLIPYHSFGETTVGGHSNDSTAVLINTQGEMQPEQEKTKRENKRRSYCTCHAVCGIFSNIYGIRQSAAGDRIILLVTMNIWKRDHCYIFNTSNKDNSHFGKSQEPKQALLSVLAHTTHTMIIMVFEQHKCAVFMYYSCWPVPLSLKNAP